jgi:hypothetical protein
MFRGSLHLFRGSFLAIFGAEFVLCLACDLSSPFFGFGHELSFFVFLSSSGGQRDWVRATWWRHEQDEVMDN